jgi:hypothetical protein
MVPRTQATGAEDMAGCKGATLPPDNERQDDEDRERGDCRDNPGGLEVELIHMRCNPPSRLRRFSDVARLALARCGVARC